MADIHWRSQSSRRFRRGLSAVVAVTAVTLGSFVGAQTDDADPARVHAGRAEVYRQLPVESLESLSTPDAIQSITNPGTAPTRIWRVLEHGERVECLDCIPDVAKLLYDDHPKTREISAWWLRRRIFGVFGPGEVYSQVVDTLGDAEQPERARARAADALGEFLTFAGLPHLSRAAVDDESPLVRARAVRALERMGHEGVDGAVSKALGDADEQVRLAAIEAAGRIHRFSGTDSLIERVGDDSAVVRRRAALTLGAMRVEGATAGLMELASAETESDPRVRAAAVYALGRIADPAARDVVIAAEKDPDTFVRDAARIARRRL